jgi:Transcriptional antiterminator
MIKIAWKLLEKLVSNQNTIYSLSQLSELFNVTPRSIRNYIAQINAEYPNLIILQKKWVSVNMTVNHTLKLATFKESRIAILFKELLTHKQIDYFDLAAQEYIEIPTIEKDIVHLRNFLKKYKILLSKEGTLLQMKGTEHNFRKAISSLLKSEMNNNLYTLQTLQDYYPEINLHLLEQIIKKTTNTHGIIINAYAQFDIFLHLCITISRANEIQSKEVVLADKFLSSSPFLTDFIKDVTAIINQSFGIDLNCTEQEYLLFLFASRISKVNQKNDFSSKNYLDIKLYKTINLVLNQAAKKFYVNFNDNDFIDKINIHIQNLIERIKKQQTIRNPFTKNLKNHSPLVYEISVYIALELQKKLQIIITEDEISFFALHIGSFILQDNRLIDMLTCIVVYPNYNETQKMGIRRLRDTFKLDLEIISIVNEMTSLIEAQNVDLIISVIPLLNIKNVIYISPLINRNDIKIIEKNIASLRRQKTSIDIKNAFVQILSEKFFSKDVYLASEKDYITFMCNQLQKVDIVDANFLYSTLAREAISSTAFNNIIAIPHPLEMTAKKTTISVIVNQEPTQWGDSCIHIIILYALSKNDLTQFYDIFDNLIELFSQAENAQLLINAKNYDDFVNKVVSLIS